MARTFEIFADDSPAPYTRITDKDGVAPLGDRGGGYGEWSFEVVGDESDLTQLTAMVRFRHDPSGTEFGAVTFGELTDVSISGVDVLSTATNMRDVIEGMGTVFLTPSIAVTLSGGATSANQVTHNTKLDEIKTKQDTGNASLSSIDTKLSSQSTASNQTTGNGHLSDLKGYVGADETGTTLRGRIKTWYDAAIAFFSAITTIIVSGKINTRAAETDALIGALTSPAAGSVNAQLALLGALPLLDTTWTITNPTTDGTTWTLKTTLGITVEYTLANNGAGDVDMILQGKLGGGDWNDIDADFTLVGNVKGYLIYSILAGNPPYGDYRVKITRNGGSTADASGSVLAVR